MRRVYNKWFSESLSKEMELLVFGYSGTPVLFFPPRTGRFYDYENWGVIAALQNKIERGYIQVYCVDSNDIESFYAATHPAEKISRHLQYEKYIVEEVLPYIRDRNPSSFTISAGCSLGGYHALNIALKHPLEFTKIVSMSARYDLSLSSSTFPNLFDGYYDENIYYNMPSMYLPNLVDEIILESLRRMDITLVIGKEDPFLPNNMHLSQCLSDKKIDHNLFIWDEEAHRPRYWRKMVPIYL
ncbi:hypothetical protein DYBT9275_03243 [Dyadobacter sp. CECT 9275]|uniref:Esterase n=1 Tax=Dyadobacter helix TaxID=2822344 RepID=A0A916JDP5_9BACT|nr:alpha/beta hydrolase-fold protein [Dyadobacter sp. CECT 9275]CAG5003855.1 hypothetical protein DYBT9275_03243 [Dyadobacter sp. CECT 9275]